MQHARILVALVAVLATLTALGCASPTPTSVPTSTPIPPVHQLVTCREIADEMTLDYESIRNITRLSTQFKGQDRLECRGWADLGWAADESVELTARRDYRGDIYYSISWD